MTITTEGLKAAYAALDDAAQQMTKAALPPALARKNVDDYTDEERAAVAAVLAAVAAGRRRAADEMAKAEVDAPVVDLDDLPHLVNTDGLRHRLGQASADPEVYARLNHAWVSAGLGQIPDLMDPLEYGKAEGLVAYHEESILSGDPRMVQMRALLDDAERKANALPSPVRGVCLHRVRVEAGGFNPVPPTEGRAAHVAAIVAACQRDAEALPPTPAELPPVGVAAVPPSPVAPPADGTIDDIMAWVHQSEVDVALRAAVARSHEAAAKKPRKRLLAKLAELAPETAIAEVETEENPHGSSQTPPATPEASEASEEAPASTSHAGADASGSSAPETSSSEGEGVSASGPPAADADAPDIDWELVSGLLDALETDLNMLRDIVKEMV